MAVTIKDIAKIAGVSISTVSKVINDSPTIPDTTKNRIRKIMEEQKYYPNRIARSFVQQSSNIIGIFMELKRSDAFLNPYLYEILGGIEVIAHENGYLLNLSNVSSLVNGKNALDKIVMEKRVDGLILHVASINKSIVQKLEDLNFPYIVIGQPNFESNACWIDINNKLAGEIATSHLLDEGYKRIAFIGGTTDDAITTKRQQGYISVLQTNGMGINKAYIKEGDSTAEDGFRLMNELLDLPKIPDSVVCASNFIAFGAMQAIKKKKLSVPKDIAVIGFDNYPLSQYTEPELSVVDIDVFELGVHAANALMNKLKNPSLQVQYNMLSPNLIVRDSSKRG
ncbi:MAG: LacI family transcriptional regulator [Clostridia bacterium]|nr:LacI family transcriptional regulator [Clostridia bacterium]